MTNTELANEQQYVARLYARLDAIKDEAETQLEQVRYSAPGGTHQNRSERDAMARIFEDRIVQLREVNERLAFGRLQTAEGDLRYIGRIGLRDEELQPLLLDWRVPQASAFYQATAATPLGIVARRHLSSKGREITAIEDEVFDTANAPEGTALNGESALMAALTATRTGRMHDIVATIQGEQDRIIRSEVRGVLVVQGGPGTGKTAVALHRAAYLLYTHRDRLTRSGVLIVGPSRSFLQYIEQVLPSLGETGVVLRSVGQLYPGIDTAAEDSPEVAALKGEERMADLIARAVQSRQIVPDGPQTVHVNGEDLEVQPELILRAMRKAQQTRKPYNKARVTFVKEALNELTRQLSEQLLGNGNTIEEEDRRMLREDIRSSHDVRVMLNTAWLPLTPEKLLGDLYSRPSWLATITHNWQSADRKLLARSRDEPFTVSDVPLLDEAAELLGEADVRADAERREEKAQRKRDIENAERAIENMDVEGMVSAEALAAGFAESAERLTTAERAATDRTWTYGHVVVDEAQELSPMQWRLLRRRAPLRSFTIVGDLAQASSLSAAPTWTAALAALTDEFRVEQLTVNYRTPRQIVDLADNVAAQYELPITASQSVRESIWPVFRYPADGDASTVDEAAADEVSADRVADEVGFEAASTLLAVSADTFIDSLGTLAVIAPERLVDELHGYLSANLTEPIGLGSETLTARISVLTPRTAKGLEFDAVVVVNPEEIVGDANGAGSLYVALTRPTQRLHIVGILDVQESAETVGAHLADSNEELAPEGVEE